MELSPLVCDSNPTTVRPGMERISGRGLDAIKRRSRNLASTG